MQERLLFYDVPDYVSRLSADLTSRAWRQSIYTPPVDPAVARTVKDGWPLDHYGNPRTHHMRLDAQENAYLCGWSASATSLEPWWSPYVWKLEPERGDPVAKLYQYDPLSGGGNRLGGTVSDTAVVTLALDGDGNLLTSLIADGGNTVIGWSPKGDGAKFAGPIQGGPFNVKLVHFWGHVHRVDAKSHEGLGGRIGPWAWVTDLASLPDRNVLAVGRYNDKFAWTDDAWWTESSLDNPNAFVRVYSPQCELRSRTAIPGFVPFAACDIGQNRIMLVGRAEQGVAPVKNALMAKSPGGSDGYFLMLSCTP